MIESGKLNLRTIGDAVTNPKMLVQWVRMRR